MTGTILKPKGSVRPDFRFIIDQVPPGSSVLDLGCENGQLLSLLRDVKKVSGQGVEISIEGAKACIEQGIGVFQGDIMEGLHDLEDNSFDYVILSQTLHELLNPDEILSEILRVGNHAIISFFNLAYFKYRLSFLFKGRFPKKFPYSWKSTYASIITLKDFLDYIEESGVNIEDKIYLGAGGKRIGHQFANLRAQVVLFVLEKR
ncbi:MAG: methionine biosynthesis protein MetW [Promethearchaeota archaeon]